MRFYLSFQFKNFDDHPISERVNTKIPFNVEEIYRTVFILVYYKLL